MASFIYIDNDRLKISFSTKVIKAKDYSRIVTAEAILSEARLKACRIILEAQQKAEEIIQEAKITYTSEKQRGYQEGLETAKQEMASQISTAAIKTAQYYHSTEEKIVNLVMDTVRKVVDGIDQTELICGLVKRALTGMKSRKQIILKVAPIQVDFLNERLTEIMTAYPQIDTIEIRCDERLTPGKLIIESDIGIVDASIDTQLSVIEEAFSNCLKK